MLFRSIQQVSNGIVSLTCQTTHNDYTLPANIQPRINSSTSITGITIDDLQATSLVPKTYTITMTPSTVWGTWSSGATNYGNSVSISGSKAVINAALANLTFTTTETSTHSGTIDIVITRTAPDTTTLVNTTISFNIINPIIGDFWRGGYYVGDISDTYNSGVASYRLILSEQSAETFKRIRTDATSYPTDPFPRISPWSEWNGYYNTRQVNTEKITSTSSETAIADFSVYEAFNYCRNLTLNGYSDWYIPSTNEWDVVYRSFKPAIDSNDTRSPTSTVYALGVNYYAVPVRTTVQTSTVPAQTTDPA